MIDTLGDRASYHLLEQFIPGDVFHVDSLVDHSRVLTAIASGYGRPPFEVSHSGGVFTTQLLPRGSADDRALLTTNRAVLAAMGLVRGVSHTEFIKAHDGTFYFLETSARVGGAHIVELIEAATGVNYWAEWATIELAGGKTPYTPPVMREDYAGLITCLAKDEHPDLSAFADPEVVWRMPKAYHAGVIVASPSHARVSALVADYAARFAAQFSAFIPPGATPRD